MIEFTGRVWGIRGAKNLPWAEVKRYLIKYGPWFEDLLGHCRFAWRQFPREGYGVTIYDPNVGFYLHLAEGYSRSECVPMPEWESESWAKWKGVS